MKISLKAGVEILDSGIRSLCLGFDLCDNVHDLGLKLTQRLFCLPGADIHRGFYRFTVLQHQGAKTFFTIFKDLLLTHLKRMRQEKLGELEFIKLFTAQLPAQDWSVQYDHTRILLDLPSLRLIDISSDKEHGIRNYTVVFAPRAGHHSNVAERVALYLRDQGLTRMAVVEQKCAADIPLYVDGKRHNEDFESQVAQYKKVLAYLKRLTGCPPHLIAVCQPGPLLMSTLILNPHLGKTFGSAGSPMHTEGEKGFLTSFARLMGESYIDRLITFWGRTISDPDPGRGRQCLDGTLQALGFYYLGMDQHVKNLKRLLADLKQGNTESAKRQMVFYSWYNTVHHFPTGFIRDTYKKIFVNNELIRGTLRIADRTVSIKDYPGSVPIWALGGRQDDIAPPLQATGHMELICSVCERNKLNLICNGGHMGLFRSKKILKTHYAKVVRFILDRSD